MSRTVYVVERVVFEVFDGRDATSFYDWTGSNGDHIARVPVAAFADRTAAEAHAARLEGEAYDGVSPARFGSEVREPHHSAVRSVLRRHGFDPPEFYRWDELAWEYRGVRFPEWWAAHAHAIPPAVAAEVGEALGSGYGTYRVEERELVED